MLKCHELAKKSKNLHMRMMLVCKNHAKNSSGFEKVLLQIHRKGIYVSYSPT
jgi:beta-lactamase regulating signal transducer with metallopeptidase domain